MNKIAPRTVLVVMLLALAACSMPETRIYSLNVPSGSDAPDRKDVSVTFRMQGARYLEQPYIARRLSPYQLDISRYAKWDAPPVDLVRDAFRDALVAHVRQVRVSNAIAEGSTVLTVNLRRFEEVEAAFGELVLDTEVATADGKVLRRMTVSRKVPLELKDHAGLAKALSAALNEAIRDVLTALDSTL